MKNLLSCLLSLASLSLLAESKQVDIANIRISEKFASSAIHVPIYDQGTIAELVQKATIRGTRWTTGSVYLDFLPNDQAATVNLILTARTRVEAEGLATKNPNRLGAPSKIKVTFGMHSFTETIANKRVRLSTKGVSAEPAIASAWTFLDFNNIAAAARNCLS